MARAHINSASTRSRMARVRSTAECSEFAIDEVAEVGSASIV
jgi:hypothetical protein